MFIVTWSVRELQPGGVQCAGNLRTMSESPT